MSKQAFTPGPWQFKPAAGMAFGAIRARVNGELFTIATIERLPCIGGHDDLAAQRACDAEHGNAHLFESAPELYETLRLSADAIETVIKCVGPELATVLRDRLEFARAALAKAVTP